MRTNIVIDDELMEEALSATGLSTKKEAVELGLKTLIRLKRQEKIRNFRGKLDWDGDQISATAEVRRCYRIDDRYPHTFFDQFTIGGEELGLYQR